MAYSSYNEADRITINGGSVWVNTIPNTRMQPTASTTGGKEELSQTSVSNSDTFSTLAEDESIKGKVTEETDTEINPSDTPLAGGNGQAFALGTALPIAGAALAAALLSIFLILFLRRRKRNGEGA